jgi:neutral ceramidase
MNSIKKFMVLIILISFLPLFSFSQSGTNANTMVRLGVSQINITPQVPITMSGYDARETPFTGVHDDLYASALYFSSEENKALIITTDLIGFKTEFADEIKKRISSEINIPSENIMLIAVHNHGGPAIKTYEDNLPAANEDYIRVLKEKLTLLAAEASKNPVPFQMGIGKGHCSMNINRRAEFADGGIWLGRNQDGPCDHELDVVKFEDFNHKTMAVLINWPCHGTASGQENYKITGDWPGAASRYIKKQEGQEVVVAITAGASADINPIYGPGNDFNEIEAVGYQVGKETWKTITQIITFPANSLESTSNTITFPGKKACKDQFPQKSYENGPDVTIRLNVLKIGDLVLAGISGELMTEIGMEVKELSPYTGTIIITHCNGSSGYICTDKSFTEGGYEIKVTRLMPGAEKPLINKLLEMIYSL